MVDLTVTEGPVVQDMVVEAEDDGPVQSCDEQASPAEGQETQVERNGGEAIQDAMVERPTKRAKTVTRVAPSQEVLHLSYTELKVYRVRALKYVWTSEAIRRSGHRGTSLNWWLNFVCWACAICDTPWIFLSGDKCKLTDTSGKDRTWKGVFEGDDSFCRVVVKWDPNPNANYNG